MPDFQTSEIKRYGCTKQEILEEITTFYPSSISTNQAIALHAMSTLSDVQEILEMGSSETARQYLNKAKFLLSLLGGGSLTKN